MKGAEAQAKEIFHKMVMKWLTCPFSFLIIALTGASLNLPLVWDLKKESLSLIHDWGKEAVYLGLFSGLVAGILVDKVSNVWTFLIGAIITAGSYGALSFLVDAEGTGPCIAILFLFVIAGLGSSIAVITAIVALTKNFDSGKAAFLLLTIGMVYWRLAGPMEQSMHEAFLKEVPKNLYLLISAGSQFVVLLIGAFLLTKVELGKLLDAISKDEDPTGILIYVIATALLLTSFFVLSIGLDMAFIGAIVFLSFLFINFLALILCVTIIYKAVKEGKGVGFGAIGAALLSGKEDSTTEQLIKQREYQMLLAISFLTIGTAMGFD